MPTDTKEQTKAYIAALLEERRGAEARAEHSDDEKVAEKAQQRLHDIDAELSRVGHAAKPPAKRAETRPALGVSEKR